MVVATLLKVSRIAICTWHMEESYRTLNKLVCGFTGFAWAAN